MSARIAEWAGFIFACLVVGVILTSGAAYLVILGRRAWRDFREWTREARQHWAESHLYRMVRKGKRGL